MSKTGTCHCGRTVYCMQDKLPENLTKCACSFCLKRGTLLVQCEQVQIQVTDDAVFRWNATQVAHFICQVCGCAHIR
jgi:hypothetical protein